MKKSRLATALLLCLLFAMSAFAGETGNGGRACNPETEQCPAASTAPPVSLTSIVTAAFSQIVNLVK